MTALTASGLSPTDTPLVFSNTFPFNFNPTHSACPFIVCHCLRSTQIWFPVVSYYPQHAHYSPIAKTRITWIRTRIVPLHDEMGGITGADDTCQNNHWVSGRILARWSSSRSHLFPKEMITRRRQDKNGGGRVLTDKNGGGRVLTDFFPCYCIGKHFPATV